MTTTVLRVEAVLREGMVDTRDVRSALLLLVGLQPPPRETEETSTITQWLDQSQNAYSPQCKGFGLVDMQTVSSMDAMHGYYAQIQINNQKLNAGDEISFGIIFAFVVGPPTSVHEIEIGADSTATALNLIAAINNSPYANKYLFAESVGGGLSSIVRVGFRGISEVTNLIQTTSTNQLGATQRFVRFEVIESARVQANMAPVFIVQNGEFRGTAMKSLVGQKINCMDPTRTIGRNVNGPLTVVAFNENTLEAVLSGDPSDLAAIMFDDEFVPLIGLDSENTYHNYGGQ